jgi:hypothetical protein
MNGAKLDLLLNTGTTILTKGRQLVVDITCPKKGNDLDERDGKSGIVIIL